MGLCVLLARLPAQVTLVKLDYLSTCQARAFEKSQQFRTFWGNLALAVVDGNLKCSFVVLQ